MRCSNAVQELSMKSLFTAFVERARSSAVKKQKRSATCIVVSFATTHSFFNLFVKISLHTLINHNRLSSNRRNLQHRRPRPHHGWSICRLGWSLRLLRLHPLRHTTKGRSVEFHRFRRRHRWNIGGQGGTKGHGKCGCGGWSYFGID